MQENKHCTKGRRQCLFLRWRTSTQDGIGNLNPENAFHKYKIYPTIILDRNDVYLSSNLIEMTSIYRLIR